MNVYLDNAATSMQKPEEVLDAMTAVMRQCNANPGRGGYRLSLEAGRKILGVRQKVCDLFGGESVDHVVFCQNVTMALNMAIHGLVRAGDHVLISAMEHNAVYRPVVFLAEQGVITYSVIPADGQGRTDPEDIRRLIRPETSLLVASHASNVCGTIFPLRAAAAIARDHGITVVVDAAQTAGVLPLDMVADGIDVLAFTGHKHLLGPTGTGGFVINDQTASRMRPLLQGGTGSVSHLAGQPDFLPDKFESGTLNTVGLAGLGAGIDWLGAAGLDNERQREMELTRRLLDGMKEMPRIRLYGSRDSRERTGTIAFNLDGVDNGELCYVLDEEFSIMGRPGLHCSPLGHQTLGTLPEGTMRFSVGAFTTAEEIDYVLASLQEIVEALD